MIEFLIETDAGWEPAYSQKDASHVRMSSEEYEELVDGQYKDSGLDSLISSAKSVAAGGSDPEPDLRSAAEERIRELEKALLSARKAAAYERSLNENFRRIFKERSNADRKLRPKREHTGYSIILSAEKEKFYFSNKKKVTVNLWETVLETPYTSDFTVGQVKRETLELTAKQEDGTRLIGKIGVGQLYGNGLAQFFAMPEEKRRAWEKVNPVLSRRFKFNSKSGYWELALLHLFPLTCYHATMMPPKKKDSGAEVEESHATNK